MTAVVSSLITSSKVRSDVLVLRPNLFSKTRFPENLRFVAYIYFFGQGYSRS